MLGGTVHYVVDHAGELECRVAMVVSSYELPFGAPMPELDLDVFPNFGIDASVFPDELVPVGTVHGLIWRGGVKLALDGVGTYHTAGTCPRGKGAS